MRYSTGLAIAVLALLIGWPWLNSAAQTPGGSYRETCRDVSVRGSTLYAKCKDTTNQWRDTELRDYQRCRGEIQNLNGNLSCTGEGNAYTGQRDHDHDADRDHDHDADHDRDHDRDRDSYRQTCQDVRQAGNTLKAKCQKVDGGWRNTSLKNFNNCRNIVNEDGHLRCR
jgi:hypothetical protein